MTFVIRTDLRIMLHMKNLPSATWHYDATITSCQVGNKVLPCCRYKPQPRPYLPQNWCVKDLLIHFMETVRRKWKYYVHMIYICMQFP